MAEYIISRVVILFVVIGLGACRNNVCKRTIPTELISQSIALILKEKRYQKSVYNKIKIERNDLVTDIKPFQIDTFNIEMIDKLKENDSVYNHASSFYFYKYANIAGGGIEIEFTIYPAEKHVRFYFTEDENKKWKLKNREDWQF